MLMIENSGRILTYKEIEREEWRRLVASSKTGTWFQGPEAYSFYESLPDLFQPFVLGVASIQLPPKGKRAEHHPSLQERTEDRLILRGVCVGYVTVEKNAVRQFFTRRAIILGGPVIANDATDAEVFALLEAVKTKTRNLQSLDNDLTSIDPQPARKQASRQTTAQSCAAGTESPQDSSQKHAALTKNTKNIFNLYTPIYIETRNFNDYSKWKDAFAAAEFDYMPHLNFHVDPATNNLSDNRCRQIRRACEAGATTMIIDKMSAVEPLNDEAQIREQPTQTLPKGKADMDVTEAEIKEWYEILRELYRTKVKTPLWPVEFFLEAYRQGMGKFLLVKHEGNVIGGNMVVTDGKTVYEWFECGMNAEYKEQYPSVMATWAGIQWAKENGCARYDMMGAGEPGVPYGVRDFKSEFGGEMVEHGRFLCVNKPMLYRIGALAVRILRKLK